MGQEISQQSKCSSNITRRQTQTTNTNDPIHQHQHQHNQHYLNEKHQANTKHKDLIYTPASSISTTSSTTDDEHYRQRQKYNLSKQTYEKTKVAKKLSFISTSTTNTTTTSDSSDYQNCSLSSASRASTEHNYENVQNLTPSQKFLNGLSQHQHHQRKSSQSTDSGIYYSTCHCSSASSRSSASSTSGFSTSAVSQRSNKSLDKQKHYLSHHLYIKSYLDILEEDEKARAHFKGAKPGGIRNYTPKILAEAALSASAPVGLGVAGGAAPSASGKQRGAKCKEDPWI